MSDELALLSDALELCEGFSLHFVLVAGPLREQALAERLREQAERLSLPFRELRASDVGIAARLGAEHAQGLTLLRTVDASRSEPAALARCFVELNPRRDVIAGRHLGPLVIACRPDALRRLVELAPDLYSIHTTLVQIMQPERARARPDWLLFDHEALGLLGLDPAFHVFDGAAIPRFRVAQPEPARAALPERDATALRHRLLDASTRVVVGCEAESGPGWLVAALVHELAREWDEVVWLDGSAPTSTLLYELVRSLIPAPARPPVEADDLAACYARASASRRVLIVVDEPREAFPSPSAPSKLVVLVREREAAELELAAPPGPVPTRAAKLGWPREWEELLPLSAELEQTDHARLWRLTRGLLDASLPSHLRDAAERRWQAAAPALVEAASAVCAPADGPPFLAALAELRRSSGYLRDAIELSLCVHARPEQFEPWLELLEPHDPVGAADLRFRATLRYGGDRAQALTRWADQVPVAARMLSLVRRVFVRDAAPVDTRELDPRRALVELLRCLDARELERLEQAFAELRADWPAGAPVLDHLRGVAVCLVHLAAGRWEPARVALEQADAAASSWADPHALLRAGMLAIEYARARGDAEAAQRALPAVLARAESLLGPHHPATLELLAAAIEIHDDAGAPEHALTLADLLWQRLEHVERPPRAVLLVMLAHAEANDRRARSASLRERWPELAVIRSTPPGAGTRGA